MSATVPQAIEATGTVQPDATLPHAPSTASLPMFVGSSAVDSDEVSFAMTLGGYVTKYVPTRGTYCQIFLEYQILEC